MQWSGELFPSDGVAGVGGAGSPPFRVVCPAVTLDILCSDVVIFLACIAMALWAFLVSQVGGGGGGP